MNKKNTDPHYLKPIKKQRFEPRNKKQAEEADSLIFSCKARPLNKNTNCRSIVDEEVSNIEGMSNKEFYAMRRGKQSRFNG